MTTCSMRCSRPRSRLRPKDKWAARLLLGQVIAWAVKVAWLVWETAARWL